MFPSTMVPLPMRSHGSGWTLLRDVTSRPTVVLQPVRRHVPTSLQQTVVLHLVRNHGWRWSLIRDIPAPLGQPWSFIQRGAMVQGGPSTEKSQHPVANRGPSPSKKTHPSTSTTNHGPASGEEPWFKLDLHQSRPSTMVLRPMRSHGWRWTLIGDVPAPHGQPWCCTQ